MSSTQLSDIEELLGKKKSLFPNGNREIFCFFCPQCRAERKVPFRSRPGGKHYFQIAVAAGFFTLVTWQWFGMRGLVSFVPLWAVFEVSYRLQLRARLSCEQCGFDPFLYLRDVKRARQEIESHWRAKFAEKNIPFPEKNGTTRRVGSAGTMQSAEDSTSTS